MCCVFVGPVMKKSATFLKQHFDQMYQSCRIGWFSLVKSARDFFGNETTKCCQQESTRWTQLPWWHFVADDLTLLTTAGWEFKRTSLMTSNYSPQVSIWSENVTTTTGIVKKKSGICCYDNGGEKNNTSIIQRVEIDLRSPQWWKQTTVYECFETRPGPGCQAHFLFSHIWCII